MAKPWEKVPAGGEGSCPLELRVLVFLPEVVPVLEALLLGDVAIVDAAFLDQRDRIVGRAVDLAGALGFLRILLVQQLAAALGDAKPG